MGICEGQINDTSQCSFIVTALDRRFQRLRDRRCEVPSAAAAPRSLLTSLISQVADAGVIKAGHTGWNQSEITVQNIMAQVEGREMEMVHYKPSPPQIKVTLGLVSSCSLLPFS